jgi:hypothetical protein
MLGEYAKALLGHEPTHLMTHVTRPVVSKGLWRDLKVCHHLDAMFATRKETGVLFILTSGAGVRRVQDVCTMECSYGWPRHHRAGYPDLVGPEVELWRDIDQFNIGHKHVQVVLVNQFGWSHSRIGERLPKDMHMTDLRHATDAEFGMATYEPFGISPLEPLGSGAICVISNVCGCCGFVNHATGGRGTPNVVVADFTQLDREHSIDELKDMTREERDGLEESVAQQVAGTINDRLPRTDAQREALLASGQALIRRMGWDQVIQDGLLPLLDRLRHVPATNDNNG